MVICPLVPNLISVWIYGQYHRNRDGDIKMSKNIANIIKQTKAFQFQTKDFDDEKGIVRGYLSTFNNVDEGGDRVLPGSFKRTLDYKYENKKDNNKRYLMPLLWQHDPNTPIGGYLEAKEDTIGLFVELELDLDVQKGKETYSALKKGYVFQQSIGYDAVQSEYVKVDGKMVRDLIEIRLWEGSIVVFPMNEEAVITDVKTITGSTSLPIGPRDESWDSSKAEKQIFAYAQKEDETFDVSKLKKCFMVQDGDAQKKGSWSYPFCYVEDDKPHICVGAVIAIVGAIGGARGADAPDGLKGKCETLYNRINKLYPDDSQLSPPWKDDSGKSLGRHMDRKDKEKKTVQEHYAEEMCKNLLKDWADVYLCAVTKSVLDALKIGDQPEQDISQALDGWKELVLSKFVAQAAECDLSGYISDNSDTYSSADYTMLYGSSSRYGYMSNEQDREAKSGKPISAANQQTIDEHVKSLKSTAKKANSSMRDHVKAMHDTADSVEDLAGDDKKSGRAISAATAQSIKDYASTMHEHADKAMDIMKDHAKAVRTAADDLATRMQGAETPYAGDDPGTPDPGQQEGKGNNRVIPPEKEHNTHERPSEEETVSEKDLELMLAYVQGIKTA